MKFFISRYCFLFKIEESLSPTNSKTIKCQDTRSMKHPISNEALIGPTTSKVYTTFAFRNILIPLSLKHLIPTKCYCPSTMLHISIVFLVDFTLILHWTVWQLDFSSLWIWKFNHFFFEEVLIWNDKFREQFPYEVQTKTQFNNVISRLFRLLKHICQHIRYHKYLVISN